MVFMARLSNKIGVGLGRFLDIDKIAKDIGDFSELKVPPQS